jgi:hypothetical protein
LMNTVTICSKARRRSSRKSSQNMNRTFLADSESGHALPEQYIENILSWNL